jgi:hypothetical protein
MTEYDPSKYTVDTSIVSKYTIKQTEPSNWQCFLLGDRKTFEGSVVWRPVKGSEPNWFHRKMQELCFGFKWRKVK